MKQKTEDRGQKTKRIHRGSAIILAIVLTSLLAIVGVIFLLSSRVDSIATSAISENENLNLAVDSVIASISQSLAADVNLQADPNRYCDYPDVFNPFLACLEPDSDLGYYRWRHISDPYGILEQLQLAGYMDDFADTAGPFDLRVRIVADAAPVTGATLLSRIDFGGPADADGDGVADSRWVKIPAITSSKGKPIYAAIRVIDNSGMLNVNTGLRFDPCSPAIYDGSSQMQINLLGLSVRGSTTNPLDKLFTYRCGSADGNFYEPNVIWQYGNPIGAFTPFDVSDELKLRNRYLINKNLISTRIELLWDKVFDGPLYVPHELGDPLDEWFLKANYTSPDPCVYDYRHIATTYNIDRAINPIGGNMLNINRAPQFDPNSIRNTITGALVEGGALPANAEFLGAQIAANLIDYVDGPGYFSSDPRNDPNNNVTVVYDNAGIPHFGFEQPCIYISEIAQNFFQPDANDANIIFSSYAIELFKPYAEDLPPGPVNTDWSLVVSGTGVPIPFTWAGNRNFHVFYNDDYNVIDINLAEFEANNPSPLNGAVGVAPNVILQWPPVTGAVSYDIYFGTSQIEVTYATPADANVFQGTVPSSTTSFDPPGLLDMNTIYFWRIDSKDSKGVPRVGIVLRFTVSLPPASNPLVVFNGGDIISLYRRVYDPRTNSYINLLVDAVAVPVADPNFPAWLRTEVNNPAEPNIRYETHSFQRDTFPNMLISRLWDKNFNQINNPTIGQFNEFAFVDPSFVIQAHPANNTFNNVGEFGQLFFAPTYFYGGMGPDFINTMVSEPQVRINLADPNLPYQKVFKYLTVMDPRDHTPDPNETRIKGRININTAPWYVLVQLPWVSYQNWDLARAIADYRDNKGGFKSIGDLMGVIDANIIQSTASIAYYMDKAIPAGLLTPPDGAGDTFEQRDAIFARISNLVTVRSDVFTTYILVRIGADGPQKRVVAILDRSGVGLAGGKVKVVAIQQVPDPH
jgi:hypothetical protein